MNGNPKIPSTDECIAILNANETPPHILRHSLQVARVAKFLSEEINRNDGEAIDVDLVEAAAILHDIAKAACFDDGKDHAKEGAVILRSLGFAAVAGLVERHVKLGEWDKHGPIEEAELLNYSDKRVQHERLVSLDERFEDILDRYGKIHPEAYDRCKQYWAASKLLEKKIFRNLSFGPDEIVTLLA